MQKFTQSLRAFFAAMLLLITGITYSQNWSGTGAINPARTGHAATLLANGKVLVAGGFDGSHYLDSCALYDAATGTWSSTGPMADGRQNATATLLQNGMVLVTGGIDGHGVLNTCELYDPVAGTWSNTMPMASPRDLHTATLLPGGKVLVTGGKGGGGNNYLSSCELYDPAAGTWSTVMPMANSRSLHSATLLSNGKVLVAGGYNGSYFKTCEIYDPAANTWSATDSLATARDAQTATLLPGGKVLVAGGYNNGYLNSCELYDAATGTWSNTGSMLSAREYHTAILLQKGGQVLITGGYNGNYLSSSELYDVVAGTWNSTGSMITARQSHTATVLLNGRILVTGGYNGDYLDSSELSSYLVYKNLITAIAGANGSISPGGFTNINDGSSRTYTIVPNANYHITDVKIDGLTDNGAINSGSYTFTNIVADHTIQATFVADTYTIATSAGADGRIDTTVTVNYGTDTTIHITPDPGYHIADVLVDGASVGAVTSYKFTNVTADHTISATFQSSSITYAIKASTGANGSIAPAGTTNVTWGNNQTYSITPATGFHIVKLTVDGLSVTPAPVYTFTNVTAPHTISATFATNKYTITSTSGLHGTITPKGKFQVNYNGGQTYIMSPASGYGVADVLVDSVSVGAVPGYTFTNVTADHTIRATFICIKPVAPIVSGPSSVTKHQSNLVYTVTNAQAGTGYTWTVPTSALILSGQGTPSITVTWGTANGNVGCTAKGVCSNSTKTLYAITVSAGFANVGSMESNAASTQAASGLQVIPNPVQDKAKLVFTVLQAEKCSFQLLDLTGKILAAKEVNAKKGVNETTLDVSGFARGTYFISLSDGKERRIVMLVKAK